MGKYLKAFIPVLCALLLFNLIFTDQVLGEEKFVIKMRQGKFLPQTITIAKGEEITFINEDNSPHWPASNIHPAHKIYPEFDPKQSISPGDKWTFKFERAGNFKFHDHLNPQVVGEVSVTGDSFLQNLKVDLLGWDFLKAYFMRVYYLISPKSFANDLKMFDAYKVSSDEIKLKYWLVILGSKQYMDKLVEVTAGGSKVDCHQESHQIGRISYNLFGYSVFSNIDYNCHSGFLHGAMEAFIAQAGDQNLISKTEGLCKNFSSDFGKFECLHGIGHGLTAYISYDIPEALRLCKKLSTDFARRSCFGGVFMENIMVAEGRGALRGHITHWVSADSLFPCDGVDPDEHIQYECYQMQTSRMLQLFDYNFPKIAMECQRAPQNMVPVCFRSMGRDIAGQALRDPDKMIPLCQLSPPGMFKECMIGGLNVIVDFWGEGISDQPAQFCNKLTLTDNKADCYKVLSERLVNIFGKNRGKIEEVCKFAGPDNEKMCLGG